MMSTGILLARPSSTVLLLQRKHSSLSRSISLLTLSLVASSSSRAHVLVYFTDTSCCLPVRQSPPPPLRSFHSNIHSSRHFFTCCNSSRVFRSATMTWSDSSDPTISATFSPSLYTCSVGIFVTFTCSMFQTTLPISSLGGQQRILAFRLAT